MPPVAPDEIQLRELCRDAAHCSCAYGNALIFYSGAEPEASFCDRSAAAAVAYAQAYPQGLGLLVLIAAHEPPPSAATRAVILNGYIAMRDVVRIGVLVVEGEGFAAAAKRSAITLLNFSTNLPFPMKVAGTTTEGAAKLTKSMGPRLDPRLSVPLIAAAAAAVKARVR